MEFNRPANLKLIGNISDNFKTFKQEVEVYFLATETNQKPKEVQVARLLNLLGPDGLKLFNTFKIEDTSIETIFKCLEEYCVPKKNVVMEHYKYFTRKQNENESFDKFYADLRELIKSCAFGEAEETLLCSQIVLGIHDKDLQTRLLREDLPLSKIIKYCQAVEQAEMHRRVVQKESPALDQIEERQQFKSKGWSQVKQNNKSQRKQEHKNKNQYRCRTIKTNKTTPRSLKTKNCQHRSEERQYCWNCNSRISPRCGRRLSRHLARSVSVPPTRNVHKSVPCIIRSKSMPYSEKDTRKMPMNFENSSIKTCFSLSSLHPSTVNVEGGQQAAQRPYNSLTKKIKKNETTNQDCWRGDSSYEFLSSLRASYQYLMDNNLIESCREVGCDLNNASPIQDWNVERLNIYIKELEKSFCSGSESKPNSCNLTENVLSPKRLSMSEEVRRLNILRHIAQLSKRLPHCREPSLNQSCSSIYNAHYLELKSNLRSLDQWMAQMEVRLKPNYFRVNWNRREIRQKAEEHKFIHSDIESKGKCIRLVLKYCKWLADEHHQPTTPVHQELVQTVPRLTKKARNFEHRWQLLYIRSLEWICFIESLTVKKCRKDSNSSSDCDEEPVHKCPRLVDHKLSNSSDGEQVNSEMETKTSPSPVLQSERMPFDDTANFHRSDRKGPNLATFYYRHLDTDSEQESQKKSIVETEVKTSESSEEEEWTYSANTTKEVKKPEVPVSLAERANIEEIKALVENVNWSVSKNKQSEKLWMSGCGVKRKIFRHETVDPENEDFIGDSCDASGEYTTEDDDHHFNSDNHSYSSRSCDITVVQTQELDFSSSPGNINDCSSPKVELRPKTNTGNTLRPVSMSGLPQSSPKARLLTESCQLSVSESALNHISHEQVSVNGRDSSTIEESTATQTQDCCGSYNTNSLRRRKLKHRRKSTVERKSKSGSADSLSSIVNSVTYNEMITSDSISGSLGGNTHIDSSQRVDSETEEEVTKDSKRPAGRKRPMKMPVFRLGEFGAVTPREKRFPLTAQLQSGTTTDFSSFSEQAWDSYQEKYLSEPYSEDPPDPESVRRLLDFGDDYRKCFDSQSDCASSIGRPSFIDDETFEQDSSDSVRKLILRSRLQLNQLSKLVAHPNSNLTVTEIGQLKQRCRENEYCLRLCLEGIKDSQTFVSGNDIAEIESMVKKCERLELDISKQEKIQLLKTDIAAIKSRLMSFLRNDRQDSNIQNKNELQALIHTAKTELSSLDTYWNGRKIVSITEELNRHFNELNNSNTVLNHMNKEIADLYSIYTSTRQRLESEILRYQNALITWAECDKQLMELEMKFKGFGDNGIVCGNQKSGCFGSASDSGMSDSGSEHELNEHEKRLVNLKQLANNLMTIMTPGSEALSSILARIENNEKQLKELQQTCKDLVGRSELCIDDDKLDGCESLVNTDIVDADVAAEETIAETPVNNNNARFRRMSWIAGTFYLIVMILWSVDWLEPQCCDLQNNYKWSFALGLRYINGPPPT